MKDKLITIKASAKDKKNWPRVSKKAKKHNLPVADFVIKASDAYNPQ